MKRSPYSFDEGLYDVFVALLLTLIAYSVVEIARPGVVTAHINLLGLLAVGGGLIWRSAANRLVAPLPNALVALGVGGILAVAADGSVSLRLAAGFSASVLCFVIGRIITYD